MSETRNDAVVRYCNTIERFPVLDRDEEHRLATEYRRTRDPRVAQRLAIGHLRLVVKIAHEYRPIYGQMIDLVQEGNVGLMEAIEKFDPGRNVRLTTYAQWWIRAHILRFVVRNSRIATFGTTAAARKAFFGFRKQTEILRREGFTPTVALLSERLGVSEDDVLAAGAGSLPDVSLDDSPWSDGDRPSWLTRLPAAPHLRPDVQVVEAERRRHLEDAIARVRRALGPRERIILTLRCTSERPATLGALGRRLGLTGERVRQIEQRINLRLRRELAETGAWIGEAA